MINEILCWYWNLHERHQYYQHPRHLQTHKLIKWWKWYSFRESVSVSFVDEKIELIVKAQGRSLRIVIVCWPPVSLLRPVCSSVFLNRFTHQSRLVFTYAPNLALSTPYVKPVGIKAFPLIRLLRKFQNRLQVIQCLLFTIYILILLGCWNPIWMSWFTLLQKW